ncbi:hypothetical protein N7468_003794 [Penicillium chermesinum]|uniref:Alpha/beta hydrolase fold-3 domain-containing protein n=1 Tax=Penicillium chermesinum TaxID=63820 RepID=A0A9W9P7L6_9EURO|nr:uncharacterized protein N7468_003794 [Penicillium chermesinum]KAJ5239175.1 hypothetical protein N7468_003794 [Penicillium chermesinum]
MADFSQYGIPSPEWVALEPTLSSLPSDLTAEQQRAVVNKVREEASARAISEGLGAHIQTKDYTFPSRDGASLEIRTYRPVGVPETQPLPVFIYFHGGGFLMGTIGTEDAACAQLIKGNVEKNHPIVVVNVNYRHTPEYKYPTAWDDVEDAFIWVHDHIADIGGLADQVVVGGVSAGGQLAAALTLTQVRGENQRIAALPKIRGQVLIIPCLVHPHYYAPRVEKLRSPEVSSRVHYLVSRGGAKGRENDFRMNPGNAPPEDVKKLPPTTFGIAGSDPLRDEALFYSQLLSENGVPTATHIFPGLPHGFRIVGELKSNKAWDRVMSDGISWALSNPAAGPFEIKVE